MSVVDSEVVRVLQSFGLQYTINYSFQRKKSIFVPSSNIHKIIINEVIYFVSYLNQRLYSCVYLISL